MSVCALGYVVVETSDLARWVDFGTRILGMMEGTSNDPDVLLLRCDDRPFRLWIRKGDRDALVAPAWELPTKSAFDAAVDSLVAAGCTIERAGDDEARGRAVYELARSSDPDGNAFEFYHGRFLDYAPFVSPAGISGYVTGESGEMGLGHVVLTAPNLAATHSFYKDVLGFADTDLGRFYLAGGGADDPGVGFAFLHARNPRHHSLALGEMPESPNGAVHMMVEVATLEDVGRTYDRVLAADSGVRLSATLGRHVNDGMTSFYMQSPSGFDIEFGWNGLQIDPDSWVATTSMTVSDWGHEWTHGND